MLITALLFEHRTATLIGQQSQHYGAALARTAAQQAIDATLNHDLVSLQVTLQDLTSNPGVVLATIHDVENNLLVQAGNAAVARNTNSKVVHTAPITLHDSVAGYVTVTLAEPNSHRLAVMATVTAIALLLMLIAGLSLHERRADIFVMKPRTRPKNNTEEPDELDQQERDGSEDSAAAENFSVFAQVRVHNLAALHQQLSAEMFQTTIAEFSRVLEDVLALYNGKIVYDQVHSGEADEQLFRFESSESHAEAVFRATCSVYLIMQLAAKLPPFPLTLGADIAIAEDSCMADEPNSTITWPGLLFDQQTAQEPLLQHRLVFAEASGYAGKVKLSDFHQPYRALLEKQCVQLKQAHRK